MRTEKNSVDEREIEHFAKDSSRWWDEDGPFRPLHRLNPVRIEYIRDRIATHFSIKTNDSNLLKGLNILDIGCGGGLVCEPLARLGAQTEGLDADANAVKTAKDHAQKSGLDISYHHGSAEDFLEKHKEQYDVVLALEIVEHVRDIPSFIETAAALCKPGGLLILSTLNRTPKSFLLGIVAAEHILRWVPAGTHQWKKFVRPSELSRYIRNAGLQPADISGLVFNPLANEFKLSRNDIDVNYFITAEKNLS